MAKFDYWKSECGTVVLFLGDCRAVLPTLEFSPAMGLLTDPPYGIGYSSGFGSSQWGDGSIQGDLDVSVRDEALRLIPLDSIAGLVFGTWKAPCPPGTRAKLIWDTLGALGMGDLRIPWKPSHQEIYVLGNPGGFCGQRGTDVIQHPPVQSMAKNGRLHPFQKPVGLLEILLQKMKCRVVLDPFMGVGSSGVAAIRLGRCFIGVELEPGYFHEAIDRCKEALAKSHFLKLTQEIQGSLFDQALPPEPS